MAKRSTSSLSQGANQIKQEFQTGLNTADRVGGWLLDMLESSILEYDPASAYAAGRYVVYNGILYKAISLAQAAQSPFSHPALWEGKLITNPDHIVENGPDLPVAGPAVFKYIKDKLANVGGGGSGVNDADTTTKGIVRRGTVEDFEALMEESEEPVADINAYVGPALLLFMLDLLFGDGGLDATLERGNESDRDLTAGTLKRKRFSEGTATHYPGLIRRNGVWSEVLVPAELIGGGTGGSQLPTPPANGIPAQTFTVGTPFSYTLLPWTNVETYEVKDLPPGLSFNTATRAITGTGTLSGGYVVTVTGISPTGNRNSITVAFTGQNAAISRYFEELGFLRIGSNLKFSLKGEGGPEGIKIKFGTAGSGFNNAGFAFMTKVSTGNYEYTFNNVGDGGYTVRAEQGNGSGSIQEDFTLDTPGQQEKVYPGQINLATGRVIIASSGDESAKVNNLNLDDSFETSSEFQPLIGLGSLIESEQKARIRSVYIHTNYPADFAGAYVIAGENLSFAAGSLQTNFNKPGTISVPIPAGATSPIRIDLDDFQASQIVLQLAGTGPLRVKEWQVFGDYPVVNHPPVIATIPDITVTEGQSRDQDLNPYVSDVDGDATSLTATLEGGFPLPGWMSIPNGRLRFTAAPWEGGSLATVMEYPLVLTATDEHGSSTTQSFKVRVQRIGTLESLLNAQIKYDYIGLQKRLVIGALVTDSGPMRVNLEGVGFVYGGQGWKTMPNGSIPNFEKEHNKLLNESTANGGFSDVQPGDYTLSFQEVENGPVRSFAINIPSSNIDAKVVYEKNVEAPTGSITSITHFIDNNGHPIITAVATAPVEIAITKILGSGWNQTGYAAGTLVFGNSTYQRTYTAVAGEGSYRYDVRIIGTSIVQSNAFTIGATATDVILEVDWREITVGVGEEVLNYFNLYVQTADNDDYEWKWLDVSNWRDLVVTSSAGLPVLSGATLQAELDYNQTPISNVVRTLEIRKKGTNNTLRVTVPAGNPPHDTGSGPFYPIWTAELLVTKGVYRYDPNNNSFSVFFQPKNTTKQYEVWLETDSGVAESGSNFGSGSGSGAWSTGNWYDLIQNTSTITAPDTTLHRRYESGGVGPGLDEILHRLKVREKGTQSPIQIISFTPAGTSGSDTRPLPISAPTTGGGTGNPPPTGTKFMQLGDSLTADPRARIGFASLLTAANITHTFVGSQGAGTSGDPKHEGHSGFTIDQIKAGVSSWINTYDPEYIQLMIGTNDINGNIDLANAPARLGQLIDAIYAAKSNVKLLVSTIPLRADSTANGRVNTYNAAMATVVASRRITGRVLEYVDINASLNSGDLDADGTHLNNSGYSKVANGWKIVYDSVNAPPTFTRVREVFAVQHAINWSDLNMADKKDEIGGFFDRGGTGIKLSIYEKHWRNPVGQANFIEIFNWVVNVRKKKFGIHYFEGFETNGLPSYMDTSKAEMNHDGTYDGAILTPSKNQNDGYYAFKASGDTTKWNANTPKKRFYEDVVIDSLNKLKVIGPIWTLSRGGTHTGEGGYNSSVGSLASATFGGYEPAELAAFKAWIYTLAPGNNIAGVRTLLGKGSSFNDADIVPPYPSRSSWDAFWSVMKGPGLPQAWFEFRSRRVAQDQEIFEDYVRPICPGVPVGFEAGTFRGNQAVVNGTIEVKSIAKRADFVKANLTWADDWELGADVGRGLKPWHITDGDGSLWDPVLLLWRRGYGIPGQYSNNDVVNQHIIPYLNGNGDVGFFGNLRLFYGIMSILKTKNIIGSDLLMIYNTKSLIWQSEGDRNKTGIFNGTYTGKYTDIQLIESNWPQL